MYAIIGPMRSGTTLLYRTIKDLSVDHDSKLKDEFFQTFLNNFYVYDSGNGLYQTVGYFKNQKEEIDRRLSLLKKYNYKYTIKCLPQHLSQPVTDMIFENYDIIICERRNTWERFISFCLACTTFVFNRTKKYKPYASPVKVARQTVDDFFDLERIWKDKKELIASKKKYSHIFYEDLIENPRLTIESETSLTWRENTEFFEPIYKLYNNIKKESLISNLDEVKEWYSARSNRVVLG